jgi:uncharacterized protein YukE
MAQVEGTRIEHSRVKAEANNIRDIKAKMQNVLDDFEASMKRVGADDVFVGGASETLSQQFTKLKAKFENFTKATEDFAANYDKASDDTAKTDDKLQNLANLDRMSNIQ